MKKAFLILALMVVVCGNALAAEILIKADTKEIVAIRPDGWMWGKKETLPKFVVIKTDMLYEECKYMEYSTTKVIDPAKSEKVFIDNEKIDKAKTASEKSVIILKSELETSLKNEKTAPTVISVK